VVPSPSKLVLEASHLDLEQALYLDLRHIRLMAELAAKKTRPTRTNSCPRTLTRRSWRRQMFSQ